MSKLYTTNYIFIVNFAILLLVSVMVDNKHLKGNIKRSFQKKTSREWVKKGTPYTRPNGSNDDWYISKLMSKQVFTCVLISG